MLTRPMVCGGILFALGIVLAAVGVNILIFASAAVLSGVLVFKSRRTAVLCLIITAVVFSGYCAMSRAMIKRENIISRYSGQKERITLTVTGFPENGKVAAKLYNGKTGIWLSVEKYVELNPGDIVEGEVTLRAPAETKNSFSGYGEYLASQGIYFNGYAESVTVTDRDKSFPMGYIYSLRTYMNRLGEKHFSGDRRGLFNAMIFGDKTLVSDELYAALQASGLNHIAVVSGLHLSVIIAMLFVFVRLFFGKRRISYLFAMAGALFVTLATGAGASVVRAFIMSLVVFSAGLLYRENDSLTSLSLAALVILAINPYNIYNMGFVLSVLSVLGLILYNNKFFRIFIKFTPLKVAQTLSASASAQLTVTPLVVYWFGIITPYALFSNIFAVTLSSVYVTAGMIFAVFSWITPLNGLFVFFMNLLADGIVALCTLTSRLPFAVIACREPDLIFFLLCGVLLAAFYLYPFSGKKLYRAMVLFAAVIICVSFIPKDNSMKLSSIPYGAHSMLTVKLPDGVFSIDYPDRYGYSDSGYMINCAVMTSADCDEALKASDTLKNIIIPDGATERKEREKLTYSAKEKDVNLWFAEDFKKMELYGATLEYLPIESADNARAVKAEYNGETLISLQGLTGEELFRLKENGITFSCDTLYLPFVPNASQEDFRELCRGKIIME